MPIGIERYVYPTLIAYIRVANIFTANMRAFILLGPKPRQESGRQQSTLGSSLIANVQRHSPDTEWLREATRRSPLAGSMVFFRQPGGRKPWHPQANFLKQTSRVGC